MKGEQTKRIQEDSSRYHKYQVVEKFPELFFICDRDGTVKKGKVEGCDFDKSIYFSEPDECHKWSYCFHTHQDAQAYLDTGDNKNCVNPWKTFLSNKNYAMWRKERRKQPKKNFYRVAVDDENGLECHYFRNKQEALNYFFSIDYSKHYYVGLHDEQFGGGVERMSEDELAHGEVTVHNKDTILAKEVSYYETRGYQPFKSRHIDPFTTTHEQHR